MKLLPAMIPKKRNMKPKGVYPAETALSATVVMVLVLKMQLSSWGKAIATNLIMINVPAVVYVWSSALAMLLILSLNR